MHVFCQQDVEKTVFEKRNFLFLLMAFRIRRKVQIVHGKKKKDWWWKLFFFRMLVLPLGNDESQQITAKEREPRGMYRLMTISSPNLWEGNLCGFCHSRSIV
jgi:hypothetical protein